MMEAPALVPTLVPIEPASVADAEAERDRRLSELSAGFEKTRTTAVAGAFAPDALTYESERLKAQSRFEQVIRQTDLARLDARLKQIVDARRLAVAGPMSCSAQPASPRRDRE